MHHHISPVAINRIAYVLAAVFLLNAYVNWRPPKAFVEGYARWGYPAWWHYVTALFYFVGALLLIAPATRLYGAGLLMAVTLGALATLIRYREWKHVPVVFVLLGALSLLLP